MNNTDHENTDDIFQRSFDHGFDLGCGEETMQIVGTGVSEIEMAHGLHISGVIAGLATKLADMVGESNAHFALHRAANVVSAHCAHKRAVKDAN